MFQKLLLVSAGYLLGNPKAMKQVEVASIGLIKQGVAMMNNSNNGTNNNANPTLSTVKELTSELLSKSTTE